MALHPTKRAKERILLIGPWGAGKSFSWVTLGEWLRTSGSDSKVYVLDTDRAADRYADGYDNWDDNMVVHDVYTWNEYTAGLKDARAKGTSDDWLVVDHVSKAWEAVQNHYINEVFGTDSATFFLNAKMAGAKGSPLSDAFGTNWQVINKLYNSWIQDVIRWPGHVLCAAPAEAVVQPDRQGKGGDDKDTLNLYGSYGAKPAGQKNLGFQFLSVLLAQPKRKDTWSLSTIKDVNRERMADKQVTDFVTDYLIQIAGWKP